MYNTRCRASHACQNTHELQHQFHKAARAADKLSPTKFTAIAIPRNPVRMACLCLPSATTPVSAHSRVDLLQRDLASWPSKGQ